MTQQTIGRYQVLEEIAAGGQGAVFRAFDPDTRQIVAVKVLHETLARDNNYVERFRREASLASSIDHPNVVRIFEVGTDGDRHFMSLEFLPESLSRIIESGGQMSLDVAVEFGIQIANGLSAAHAVGVIHRDMKPQNVLIGPDGEAKVTDFGIARSETMTTMTATGAVMGTPYYMSPEQSRGDEVDSRSDVYSLGCMLYQMFTGTLPFEGNTPLAVIRQQIEEQPNPIRQVRRDLPGNIANVVETAMQKDRGRRFQTVSDLAQALNAARPAKVVREDRGRRSGMERTVPPVGAIPGTTPIPSNTWMENWAQAWTKSQRSRWAKIGTIISVVVTLLIAGARISTLDVVQEYVADLNLPVINRYLELPDETGEPGLDSMNNSQPIELGTAGVRATQTPPVTASSAPQTAVEYAVPVVQSGSVRLSPATDVAMLTPDGGVFIEIPAGAVQEEVTLEYKPVALEDVPSAVPGFTLVDRVFSLRVTTEGEDQDNWSFDESITVNVDLAGLEIFDMAEGLPGRVVIQHLRDAGDDWEPLSTEVDFELEVASAKVDSLSLFALSVRTYEAPSKPSITPTQTRQPAITPAPTKQTKPAVVSPAIQPDSLAGISQQPSREDSQVTFKSSRLEAAVRSELGIGGDDELMPNHLRHLIELDASGEGILDLEGLHYAVNLRRVDLSFNRISDISALAHLTSLRSIDLSSNRIRDIGPLEWLTTVIDLDLSDNRIDDLTPLVLNREFSDGAVLLVAGNNLDMSYQSQDVEDIQNLGRRGVEVVHDDIEEFIQTTVEYMGQSNGITWGTMTISEGYFMPVKNLTHYYTSSQEERQNGYFYSGESGYPSPTLNFGNVGSPKCSWLGTAYKGYSSISEATNLSSLRYSDENIAFGTREGEDGQCYFGLLAFMQDGRYGLLDPLSMDGSGNLKLNWWVGDAGVTDFSGAPALVTASPAPTATMIPMPAPTATMTPTPTPTATMIPTFTHTPAPFGPTVDVNMESVVSGDKIYGTYFGIAGNGDEWIGMYGEAGQDYAFLGYASLAGQKLGTVTFNAPSSPGAYELRLFAPDEETIYNLVAKSRTFVVVPPPTQTPLPTPTPVFTPTAGPTFSPTSVPLKDTGGGAIESGEPLFASIDIADDVDDWLFYGISGQEVTVRMDASTGSAVDPVVTLFSPGGESVTTDDDSGGGNSALIDGWELAQSGYYTIRAMSYSAEEGSYIISLTVKALSPATDWSTPTATPTPVPPTPLPTSTPTPEIILQEVYVDSNSNLVVSFTKNFTTCAHLLIEGSFSPVHTQNYFCDEGTVSHGLDNFAGVGEGPVVKLCHGNNYGICSNLVEVVVTAVPQLPDLVVKSISVGQGSIIYEQSPWTWVQFTVENQGLGDVTEDIRANIGSLTRDDTSVSSSGYFNMTYDGRLSPGETATHRFAVGHDSLWPPGYYRLQVKIDHYNLIEESNEANNLSDTLDFTVVDPVALPNGGFEEGGSSGPSDWIAQTRATDASLIWAESISRSGSRSLSISGSMPSGQGWPVWQVEELIPVQPSANYQFSAWYYTPTLGLPWIEIGIYDSGGRSLGSLSTGTPSSSPLPGVWHQLTLSFLSDAVSTTFDDVSYVRPALRLSLDYKSGGIDEDSTTQIYFDDAVLTLVD